MPNDSMEIPATSKKSETPSVLERVITMQPNYTLEEFFKLGTSPGGQPPEPEFSEDDILWRLQPMIKRTEPVSVEKIREILRILHSKAMESSEKKELFTRAVQELSEKADIIAL